MRTSKLLFLLVAISLAAVCSSNNKQFVDNSVVNIESNSLPGIEKIKSTDIIQYGIWKVGEAEHERLSYFLHERPGDDGKIGVFSIFDGKKKRIYEETANYFSGIEVIYLLRLQRPQIVIKRINHGGSGSFFQILDYRDGKVVKLTDEDNTLYSGESLILPQFQEGKYFSLPYQIFLTENLISEKATATVLRYQGSKYISVGKIDQSELADFFERHLVNK